MIDPMPDYRRALVPGGTFFFTVVTFNRRPLLTSDLSRQALRRAWKSIQERHPFRCDAVCLLPEHLHCIWTLPEGDADYPLRWAGIKALFSKYYLQTGGDEGVQSASMQRRGEVAIWQRRYWEHCIRDGQDYKKHLDYVHYNPVKHNLVKDVSEWKWSTFHKYKAMGYYPEGWGENISFEGEFGE